MMLLSYLTAKGEGKGKMNEHIGFHEYKDGKRFNPDCLACLAENRDEKQRLFEKSLEELRDKLTPLVPHYSKRT